MTHAQEKTLKAFYAAATEQSADKLRPLLTDDFAFKGPIGSHDNPDDYVQHLVGFGGYVSGSRYVAEGDQVVHVFVYHMTSPATAEIPMCDIFTFEGERIRAQELFVDTRLFPDMP